MCLLNNKFSADKVLKKVILQEKRAQDWENILPGTFAGEYNEYGSQNNFQIEQ